MFICERCGSTAPAGASCHKVVAVKREVHYPARKGCNRGVPEWNPKKNKMEIRPGSADDPGGVGWEIVKEIDVCPTCFGS
jgi:hypothetical protein